MPLISSLGVMNAINFGLASSALPPQTIFIASSATPYLLAYPISSLSFGTKYANPINFSGTNGKSVNISQDNSIVAISCNTSPFVDVYPWDVTSGFGTKYADPSSSISAAALSVSISTNKSYIAFSETSSPYVSVYNWNNGFGSKFSNPATTPTGAAYSVKFSKDSSSIAIGHSVSPYITSYPWSSSGFGVKYANPSTALPSDCLGVAYGNSVIAILLWFVDIST